MVSHREAQLETLSSRSYTWPLAVNLFATRTDTSVGSWTHSQRQWIPLCRTGPGSEVIANPPWGFLCSCVCQVTQQMATVMLVTPLWSSQPWFPTLFTLLLDYPHLFPQRDDLIIPSCVEVPLPGSVNHLVTWFIAGSPTESLSFQWSPPSYSWHPGGVSQTVITTHHRASGKDGVSHRWSIEFCHL